jgi:hypothetical protein
VEIVHFGCSLFNTFSFSLYFDDSIVALVSWPNLEVKAPFALVVSANSRKGKSGPPLRRKVGGGFQMPEKAAFFSKNECVCPFLGR